MPLAPSTVLDLIELFSRRLFSLVGMESANGDIANARGAKSQDP